MGLVSLNKKANHHQNEKCKDVVKDIINDDAKEKMFLHTHRMQREITQSADISIKFQTDHFDIMSMQVIETG